MGKTFKAKDRVGLRWAPAHVGTVIEAKKGGWYVVTFDESGKTFTYRARDLVSVISAAEAATQEG